MLKYLAMAAALLAISNAPAEAAYVVNVEQVGADVVTTGNGSVDLNALTYVYFGYTSSPYISASAGTILTGEKPSTVNLVYIYSGLTGPTSFGTGENVFASSSGGTVIEIDGQNAEVLIDRNYISGSPISSIATFADTTLADLGVIDGSYTYTYGTDPSDTITLNIGPTTVPEPASLALLGTAILGVGIIRRSSSSVTC